MEHSVDDPEIWRWIWMAVAATFFVGEMMTAGSFFLLPFAIGAVVATILAFLDVSITGQWIAFVTVSLASFLAMRPLARRLNQQGQVDGIGARRLVGASGTVLEQIGGEGKLGMARIDREEWRAQSATGESLSPGTLIHVVEVEGTRVIVSTAPPPPKPEN